MASTSFDGLSLRLDQLAERFPASANKAIRKAGLVADQVLVLMMPVDTGRARAGWQVSFGSPNINVPPETQRDKSGGSTLAKNRQTILTFRVGQEMFLSNAVPYVVFLDAGTSVQAPEGFSRQAAQAAIAFLRKFKYL